MLTQLSNLVNIAKQHAENQLKINRYNHTLGVVETACRLGQYFHLDTDKLKIAGYLHDIAKHFSIDEMQNICKRENIKLDQYEKNNHGLLHGKISRFIAETNNKITDLDILNAISSHTTGRVGMSIYEEIIYIADFCEPSRDYINGEEIIQLAMKNIKEAVFTVVSKKLAYVIEQKGVIHPKSVEVYNYYHIKK